MESLMIAGIFYLVAIIGLCAFAIDQALLSIKTVSIRAKGRNEFGHEWKWQKADPTTRGHWKSSKGNLVRIFPPCGSITSWFVSVCDEEEYEIAGEDAEQRAFAVGEPFTHQVRSVKKDFAPRERNWKLEGVDTFANESYPLGGDYPNEAVAVEAAKERLKELEKTQPTNQSGGQHGIQDQVYVVRPDGTKYRFTN